MKKFLIMSLALGISFVQAAAKEVFAPLEKTDIETAAPVETVQEHAPVVPVRDTEKEYKIPQELPYFGGLPPVVETRTLQGGTTIIRRETKLVEGKVTILDSDLPVKIKPANKITTSNSLLKEGDFVDFIVSEDVNKKDELLIKAGTKVRGMVLKYVENGYHGKPAEITIGQFEIVQEKDESMSLKGNVFKKGSRHDNWIDCTSFIIGPAVYWIRGGEVQLKPGKDEYTLYIGDTTRAEDL